MQKNKVEAQQNNDEMDDLIPKQSTGKKVASIIINTILIIAIILAALCTYVSYVSTSGSGVPSIFGIRIMSIQTESMYPTLEPGDMIFDTAVKDTSKLQINDIITYWTVIDGERVLNTHRITEIYDGGNYLIFRTKGDNNTADDSLTVHESEIVGQYNGTKIKGLGKVFDYLRTSSGFLIVVVIPVAIFFLYHLIQFFRVLFEYNNVKNKLRYEQERGKTEDMVESERQNMEEIRKAEREKLEAELREKLKAEILASATKKDEDSDKKSDKKSGKKSDKKSDKKSEEKSDKKSDKKSDDESDEKADEADEDVDEDASDDVEDADKSEDVDDDGEEAPETEE
ncbi:MAG: signal peptidase I [Clostridia bacterium]|nr:signal peptidase I [Clostridia bacterium]